MDEILIGDKKEHGSFITYIYNALAEGVLKQGGSCKLLFGEERTALRLAAPKGAKLADCVREAAAEVLGIGYKYEFLQARLGVSLSAREKKLLCASLIAADFESDRAYILRKMKCTEEYALDGLYSFRLAPLREKWTRIVEYIPAGFGSEDFRKFCEFLVGESKNKIYLKGSAVFGENFTPLKRSVLLGEEDAETEILLSDPGFVYCLGDVEESLGDFLQKYFAERAIFS